MCKRTRPGSRATAKSHAWHGMACDQSLCELPVRGRGRTQLGLHLSLVRMVPVSKRYGRQAPSDEGTRVTSSRLRTREGRLDLSVLKHS